VDRILKSVGLALAIVAACAAPAAATTNFGYQGFEQLYTVPAGITTLDVSMSGGDGGPGPSNDVGIPGTGGHGGTASAVVAVSPGQVLYVEVGGMGTVSSGVATPAAGGWNGGGAAAAEGVDTDQATQFVPGGSGGGATDIRTVSCGSGGCPGTTASLDSRLLVAGGGGGGGLDAEGQATVNGADADPNDNPTAAGINGGTADTSTPGGAGTDCDPPFAAGAGSLGTGGTGAVGGFINDSTPVTNGGGGGGGGYQGGGGGGACATVGEIVGGGGGGGSNFSAPPPAVTNVAMGVDTTTGADGSVSINPAPPGLQSPPTITGAFAPGSTLSVVAGKYSNAPSKFTYQWFRCDTSGNNCKPITGATGSVWPLTDTDLNTTLKVQETAQNPFAIAAPVTSAATPVIALPVTPTSPQPVVTTSQPTPQPAPAPAPAPAPVAAHLVLGSVTMAGARATVHVSCSGTTGEGCGGSLVFRAAQHGTITTKHKPTKSKIARANKRKITEVTVAGTTFALPLGTSAALAVKLNAAGRRLLNKFYRVPTDLTISGTTALSQPVTFAYKMVRSPVTWTWSYKGSQTTVEQLDVTQIPRGGQVSLLCQGHGCQSSHQSFRPKHGHSLALAPSLGKRGTLTAGAKLQITISAPNSVAKVLVITTRRNNYPSVVTACELPGSTQSATCA